MLSAGAEHHTEPRGVVNMRCHALIEATSNTMKIHSALDVEANAYCKESGHQTGFSCIVMPSKGTINTIKHGTGMFFHAIKREQPPSNTKHGCLFMPSKGTTTTTTTATRHRTSMSSKAGRLTRHSSGTSSRWLPLSNSLSLSSVSRAFRMALLALKISSMKATSAVGRYPSVFLVYSSFSRPAHGNHSET